MSKRSRRPGPWRPALVKINAHNCPRDGRRPEVAMRELVEAQAHLRRLQAVRGEAK